MSKCLIVAACIFAAVAAGDASEGSFESSDSASSAAPTPYAPPFEGSCPYTGEVDGVITSLITYAQGGTIKIDDATTKISYDFTPCRRQPALGTGCTQDEAQPVSTNAGLVVKHDGKCESKSDIFFATGQPSFKNNGWVIMYNNYMKSFFNLTIMCEQGAMNKFIVNGANFLTIADERACPVNATSVAPINVTADACSASFDDSTMTTSLDSFSKWFIDTFRGNAALPNVVLNACSTQSFSDSAFVKGCAANKMGYLAFSEGDKCTVLDQRIATFYPDGEYGQYWMNRYFTTVPKTTKRGFEVSAEETETISREVIVTCGTEEAFTGKATNGDGEEVWKFTSAQVCGAAATPVPPMTNAPSQKPKSGLTTGEVVGIVIGALALIVIILVCLRWRSAKGEEEGEYERV